MDAASRILAPFVEFSLNGANGLGAGPHALRSVHALGAAALPFARDAFPVLLDTALKGAALIAAAAAVAWLLRHRSAAARHAAWTAAVIAHLALPVLTFTMPGWRLPFLPSPPWLEASSGAASAVAASANAMSAAPSVGGPPQQQFGAESAGLRNQNAAGVIERTPSSPEGRARPAVIASTVAPRTPAPDERAATVVDERPAPSTPAAPLPALALVALLWAVGALAVLLRLAAGTWAVGRLASAGARVDDGAWLSLTQRVAGRLGVARPLTLLRGRQLAVPVTWGVVYPVVLLPPDADAWPEERRRFVLVHEMAHVQRFDALTQLAAQVALALFWFDPLLWYATHRMRVEREHACDDVVLRDGTAPSLYAGELLEMVRSIGGRSHERAAPAFAALAMARKSEFEGRMLAILDPHQNRHPVTRRGTLMTSLFVALLAVPLAALRPFQAATPPTPPVTSTASLPSTPSLPSRPSTPSAPAVRVTPSAPASPTSPRSPLSPVSPLSPSLAEMSQKLAGMSTKLAKMKAPSCDGHFRGTSISVHSDSDRPDDLKIDYVMQQDGHCVTARIRGPLILTTDETDVASLGTTGEVYLRENRAEMDRAVHIYSEGGTLHHDATVGGQTAAYDPEARAWVAELLPQLIRELGINVKPRVARLRAAGGVDAVLAEIDRIQSGGARRAYYEALLDGGKLSDAEVTRVTQQAARDLTSSGDLSAVLRKLAGGTTSPAGRAAFATALDHVASSGDRRATIEQLVHSADRDMLLVLAHAASGIASSGDRSDFLRQSAAAYLSKHDAGLRSAWFEVANTVPSSGDLSEVLQTALRFGNADAEVARQVMLSVDHVPSSGDKAEVLLAAANQRLLTTPAVREAYLAAARNVASSGDKARVLEAVAQ